MKALGVGLILGFVGLLGAPLAGHAGGKPSPSRALEAADQRLSEGEGYFRIPPKSEGPETSGAPYLFVPGDDDTGEKLPLKETSAEVSIAGVIARVQLKQVFQNKGPKPIEAVYVFPASTHAAVHGMTMRIGERTIVAKIDKRDAARASYEAAKTEGKRASLLEQQRPNVFTMNVANLMPGDTVEVRLDYSELLTPEKSIYELVVPAVVGPRYNGGTDPTSDAWIGNPYLGEGAKTPYKFNVAVHLETAIALKELSSPSHAVDVQYRSPSSADVTLKDTDGGNRDFILKYRLAGDKIETGVLAFKGEKENFFTVMIEPPVEPTAKQIPPREYIFLFDVSGSMHGFPLETAKELAKNLIGQLKPSDTFNLVFFSGAAYVMSPQGSIPATADNISKALELVGRERGSGGTELMGGLKMAYAVPKREENISRSVILVTDGFVGVEAQAFKFVRDNLNKANLFAFGIGSSVNRGLIEGLARAGQGEPFVVLDPSKAKGESDKLREYVERPVLSGIEVKFDGFNAREVAPSKLPDLMAQRPLVIYGKYEGSLGGRVTVTGFTGSGKKVFNQDLTGSTAKAANEPLKWLWARKWVEILDDERSLTPAKELDDAVADLGLTYSLLTSQTSFVAIDSEVVNKGGSQTQVKQPLPLPQGVSDYALGGRMSAMAIPAPMAPNADLSMERAPAAVKRRAAADENKSAAPSPATVVFKSSSGVGGDQVGALQAAVTKKLQSAGLPVRGDVLEVKLVVDSSGKVLVVEFVSGNKGRFEEVKKLLTGLTSATKPVGPKGNVTFGLTL